MTTSETVTKPTTDALVIERVFNAPRQLVWRAWTEPAYAQKWWGPAGFTAPHATMDVRPGGKYLLAMRSPEGQDFWSTGVYREVVPIERLVCTDSFADPEGNVVPASYYGMLEEMPLEMLVTVELEEIDGKTKMRVTHEGIPAGNMKEMTEAGWQGSFDKLDASLT